MDPAVDGDASASGAGDPTSQADNDDAAGTDAGDVPADGADAGSGAPGQQPSRSRRPKQRDPFVVAQELLQRPRQIVTPRDRLRRPDHIRHRRKGNHSFSNHDITLARGMSVSGKRHEALPDVAAGGAVRAALEATAARAWASARELVYSGSHQARATIAKRSASTASLLGGKARAGGLRRSLSSGRGPDIPPGPQRALRRIGSGAAYSHTQELDSRPAKLVPPMRASAAVVSNTPGGVGAEADAEVVLPPPTSGRKTSRRAIKVPVADATTPRRRPKPAPASPIKYVTAEDHARSPFFPPKPDPQSGSPPRAPVVMKGQLESELQHGKPTSPIHVRAMMPTPRGGSLGSPRGGLRRARSAGVGMTHPGEVVPSDGGSAPAAAAAAGAAGATAPSSIAKPVPLKRTASTGVASVDTTATADQQAKDAELVQALDEASAVAVTPTAGAASSAAASGVGGGVDDSGFSRWD